MQYGAFEEVLPEFPMGRFEVTSHQLADLICHEGCSDVAVRVLHLGTFSLDQSDIVKRLKDEIHPRLDNIKITCLDGQIIIDEPSYGCGS